MEVREAQALVGRLSYKPGSTLYLNRSMYDMRVVLVVDVKVVDVKGGYRTTLSVGKPLDAAPLHSMSQDEFIEWVRCQILELENHELDEWFMLDDAWVHDPHPGVGRKTLAEHRAEQSESFAADLDAGKRLYADGALERAFVKRMGEMADDLSRSR